MEARVAVTVWRLATNIEYCTIGALFGLGRSTVGGIVIDTCEVINDHFLQSYMYVPITHNKWLWEVVDGLKTRWGFHRLLVR